MTRNYEIWNYAKFTLLPCIYAQTHRNCAIMLHIIYVYIYILIYFFWRGGGGGGGGGKEESSRFLLAIPLQNHLGVII